MDGARQLTLLVSCSRSERAASLVWQYLGWSLMRLGKIWTWNHLKCISLLSHHDASCKESFLFLHLWIGFSCFSISLTSILVLYSKNYRYFKPEFIVFQINYLFWELNEITTIPPQNLSCPVVGRRSDHSKKEMAATGSQIIRFESSLSVWAATSWRTRKLWHPAEFSNDTNNLHLQNVVG